MAARTSPASPAPLAVLGTVRLIHGSEDLFADRAVQAAISAVRTTDPDADVTELEAASLAPGGLAELTSPSLFAANRIVVVRGLDSVATETADALLAYVAAPQPDVALLLVHRGGQKGRGVVDKLKKAKVEVVACEAPKPWELGTFVTGEVRRLKGRIDDDAANLLVEAVGTDLRTLAGAIAQLIADTDGAPISSEVVRRYFAGRAQVTGFAVAEDAIEGRPAQALEQLRWALRTGVVPVLITSALASGLRGLARLAGAPRGLREGDLAKAVGVPPWKLRSMRGQLRGWRPEGLATAIEAVARADADVKGGAYDAEYALERAVLAVCRARGSS